MYPFIILVGSKNGANSGSDASPPMQSFTEESSPENMTGSTPPLGMNIGNGRALRNCQSTESLDSLSDESGGHSHNKSSSTSSRKVIVEVSFHVRNLSLLNKNQSESLFIISHFSPILQVSMHKRTPV